MSIGQTGFLKIIVKIKKLLIFIYKGEFYNAKIKMSRGTLLSFEEDCNTPMVDMTVAVAVAIEEASK